MKPYQKLITWCIIFLCFVLFVSLLILKITGTIKIIFFWLISPLLVPGLYCACLILYGMWLGYRASMIKTAAGTFRVYDTVKYSGGEHSTEVGYLIKHGAIWVVEYIDGSQTYVEDLNLLKKEYGVKIIGRISS